METHCEAGTAILLNGASSSGKSTLARAIQDRIDQPFWHVSIDHLRDGGVLPVERIRSGDFPWSGLRKAFFRGFEASVVGYLNAGNNLIVEYIMEDAEQLDRMALLLSKFDVFFVGVRCDLEVLERREIARGDRPIGDARRDHRTVHEFCSYDAEIDGHAPARSNAERLIALWRERTRPSAFDRLAWGAR